MGHGQSYMEGAVRHPRKTQAVFHSKDVCGRALSCWKVTPLLLANSGHFCATAFFKWSSCSQYLTALMPCFSHQMYNIIFFGWSLKNSLETTIFRSPGSFALDIIIDNPLFVPGKHLQERMLLIFLEQEVTSIQALLQVSLRQFVRYPHIRSAHIPSGFEMFHNAFVWHTKSMTDFFDSQMEVYVWVMIAFLSTVQGRPERFSSLILGCRESIESFNV